MRPPGRLAGGDLHAILTISPRGDLSAEVAQLVEHVTENHGVGSSILPLGTTVPWHKSKFRRLQSRRGCTEVAAVTRIALVMRNLDGRGTCQ